MGVDTLAQRASAGGTVWPVGTLDRVAATDEYSWLTAGPFVPPAPPVPVGVPELRTLTIHRTDGGLSIGRTDSGPAQRGGGAGYTARRRK
jgi:hypothetical protein